MGTEIESRQSVRRINSGKLVLASCALFTALCWIGSWYRATIDDWDYCIRNDLCFVCHAPAHAEEGTYEDLGKNIRLCDKHSTGMQAWRWIVYGVPAELLIYEDAPLGTGRMFTRLIRFALILGWGGALATCVPLAILGLVQFAIPNKGFFDEFLCQAPRTCTCGKELEPWVRCCRQCALTPVIDPERWFIVVAPCMRFRVVNFVLPVIGVCAALVLTIAVGQFLPNLFEGVVRNILGVAFLFLIVLGLAGSYGLAKYLWGELKEPPYLLITVTRAIREQHVAAGESGVPRTRSGSIPLKDVTSVRVTAGRISNLLKCGMIVLCTREKPDGALSFEGLANPYVVKEMVEWLVKQQPAIEQLLSKGNAI